MDPSDLQIFPPRSQLSPWAHLMRVLYLGAPWVHAPRLKLQLTLGNPGLCWGEPRVHQGLGTLWRCTKEYISVIEGTAPPIVFQTFDSPNLSPAQSAVYSILLPACLTEQRRGEVGRVKCLEDEGGCCPFYHWYIFFGVRVRRFTVARGRGETIRKESIYRILQCEYWLLRVLFCWFVSPF